MESIYRGEEPLKALSIDMTPFSLLRETIPPPPQSFSTVFLMNSIPSSTWTIAPVEYLLETPRPCLKTRSSKGRR